MDNVTNNIPTSEDNNQIPVRRRFPWMSLGILFSTLGVIILIGTFFAAYNQLIRHNEQVSANLAQLNESSQQNQTNLATLQTKINELQDNLQTSLANQQKLINEVKTTTQPSRNEGSQIAEAQHLTSLANNNLLIASDIPLVISLLQNADQKLQNLPDPNIAMIRKALATDIAALQAVPKIDYQGIFMQLSALNEQVDKLPLPNKRPEPNATPIPETKGDLPWWKKGLTETKDVLSKVVVVRYTKPGEKPFIPPEQQEYLYQNLHAKFEQALTAVVQRQPEIYRSSLQQASAWIKQYFLIDSSVTQAAINQLADLEKINLRPTLPNVSASLQAFQAYFAGQSGAPSAPASTVNSM